MGDSNGASKGIQSTDEQLHTSDPPLQTVQGAVPRTVPLVHSQNMTPLLRDPWSLLGGRAIVKEGRTSKD